MSANSSNASIRPPAVAGFFYPGDRAELTTMVSELIAGVSVNPLPRAPKAYIVPHAGYVYSGSTAAIAYAMAAQQRASLRRIILIGPSHRVYLRGIAVPQADVFRTPLGEVPLDAQRKRTLVRRGDVILSDAPHAQEHSLEVQLPFLQRLLEGFEILPLVVGEAAPEHIVAVLSDVFDDTDTLLLASSDLSHYLDYEQAQRRDAETSVRIRAFANDLSGDQACGAVALNGVLTFAKHRQASITELARLNSGDTAGDRSRVVGYGAYAIHDARPRNTQ